MCWQAVLLGDAAHSMSPVLGQACSCGMEDATVFAGVSCSPSTPRCSGTGLKIVASSVKLSLLRHHLPSFEPLNGLASPLNVSRQNSVGAHGCMAPVLAQACSCGPEAVCVYTGACSSVLWQQAVIQSQTFGDGTAAGPPSWGRAAKKCKICNALALFAACLVPKGNTGRGGP